MKSALRANLLVLALFVAASPVMAGEPQVTLHFKDDEPTLLNRPLSEFKDIVRSIGFWHDATYVGTYGSGLMVLDAKGGLSTLTSSTSKLTENRVNCLEPAGDDLWIGTCNGIDRVDGHSGAWTHIGVKDGVAHNIYHVIRQDSLGRVWVGTTGKGLSRFDGKAWMSWTEKDGLPSGWINDVVEDGQGRMWAATAGGLVHLEDGRWKLVPPSGNNGKIWSHATALAVRGVEIWVGTGSQGLLMTDGTYWYAPGSEANLPSREISALLVDRAGTLWVGTSKGLASYGAGTGGAGTGAGAAWRHYGPAEGPDDPHVMILREGGSPSRVWAGSYGGQVYRLEPDRGRWVTVLRKGALALSRSGQGESAGGGTSK